MLIRSNKSSEIRKRYHLVELRIEDKTRSRAKGFGFLYALLINRTSWSFPAQPGRKAKPAAHIKNLLHGRFTTGVGLI
ncbi:hypothetical protein [Algoriphagus boritolerans]|uniref:hypothetical protein n=1 Tax=Algoriphagus boritolerans TaxID=308111 RepID=UPI000CDE819C